MRKPCGRFWRRWSARDVEFPGRDPRVSVHGGLRHRRRSCDGLSMIAEHIIRCNPLSGYLLVFSNRRSDRLKILYGDRDGWAIWYKRLEAGTFQFPFAETGRREVAAWELGLLLEGIDLSQDKRRKRYCLPAAAIERDPAAEPAACAIKQSSTFLFSACPPPVYGGPPNGRSRAGERP